ncbi:MAG: glycosyltransferase [Actinobacteria bacterium]|nr:glycosyltransferase [Actinomycetota bacterium]
MNVLCWHIHGSYTTSLVQGDHRYLIPVLPDRGPDGLGRARTWQWPPNAVEVTPADAAGAEVDVVILQRPRELHGLAERWLGGRRPGRDVPAVYLEHSAPQGRINRMRHPAADRDDLVVVHVTHFNDLFWDCGSASTTVVEHGIVDPGERYIGDVAHAGVAINEPVRRARVTGTDLLDRLRTAAPVDLFGIGVAGLDAPARDGLHALRSFEDVPQERLHEELRRRRVYVHPVRWTSLGLTLLEAMHLGMPVAALATTEVVEAVPPEAGVVTTRVDTLIDGVIRLIADPEEARRRGKAARDAALERYGLRRFLAGWDRVLEEVTR